MFKAAPDRSARRATAKQILLPTSEVTTLFRAWRRLDGDIAGTLPDSAIEAISDRREALAERMAQTPARSKADMGCKLLVAFREGRTAVGRALLISVAADCGVVFEGMTGFC
jgi:hypothetical protein